MTRTLARLLEFLQDNGHKALLLGPESGMEWYAGAEIVGTAGFPLPFYPELKFNLFRPLFIRRLKEFQPDIVHLVDPVILGAGRVSWEKNLRLLTQAYRDMPHDRCHLVIVGEGPALAEIQQELADLPVTFTGYLQGEELAAAYASADVFAFPSHTETFGQVVLEAMSSHLPVVGVLSEGVCDLVQDGSNGYLLNTAGLHEEEQAKEYRTLLEQLVNNATVRHTMGEAGLVEASFHTWPAAMKMLLDGYEEVIVGTRPLIAA